MSESIRITTAPNGGDSYLTLNINQDFDFIKILSLNISQDKVYENFCSDYGVIVGRVIINSGFGVPNAKVSVFIPVDNVDAANPQISGLYPFTTVNDKDNNGIRYNLLPSETDNQNECYTPVGTFPSKREFLDNDDMLYVYRKYYEFTTTTNYAGDFMIFGVPLGAYVVHVDADISNIGIASQRPYDLIDQGTPSKFFYSPTKFKSSTNLNSLVQIKSANVAVNVQPFWGDVNACQIGINRLDIDLNYNIRPAAIFMGSLFGDTKKNSINKNCRPRKNIGMLCEQEAAQGTIEMIRKTIDNQIEQFDIDGGRVIDDNGAWAYQIPMNLDYVVTDEFGNLIPTSDPNKGIPTRARVRFRISMDEDGSIGRIRTRGVYLVPHNPQTLSDSDFTFDSTTNDNSFTDLYWNKIYTVKNFIPRVERSASFSTPNKKTFMGIKNVDGCVGDKNPFPFNRTYTQNNILFTIICTIITLIATIVSLINGIINVIKFLGAKNIGLNCTVDDVTTPYYVGAGQTVQAFVDCQSAALTEQLELFQFDFYNDWINGTLYYYLLKYKKKRRGTEKFCETYCDEISPQNGISGTGYNHCKANKIADTTFSNLHVITDDKWESAPFENGLLVKDSNSGLLYYPPIVLDGSGLRLFSTDIVSLGAVLDCDWQGYPKIIQYITNSSYKLPPLIQEFPEQGDNLTEATVSGMITIDSQYTGLFFNIDCTGVGYNTSQATNMRRLCEMHVDLPEATGTTISPITVTIQEIYDVTDPIDSAISVNKYVRDSFYLLNTNGSLESFPWTNFGPLGTPSLGTSFGITASSTIEDHSDGSSYTAFRQYSPYNSTQYADLSHQAWGNSFYMYFGVIPNKTAINVLNSKYFTPCIPVVKDDYIIETIVTSTSTDTSSDGAISFYFIGGTAPFTYTWTGFNYSSGPSTTNNAGLIIGLSANTQPYIITAVDSLGTVVTKEIVITGPEPLACTFVPLNAPTTQSSNDGTIKILQLIGGTTPYTLNITGPNTNITLQNVNLSTSPIQNIGVGTYTFTITDSSSPVQTCSTALDITSVPPVTIQNVGITNPCASSTSPNCYGELLPILNGGVPPYTVTVSNGTYTASYPYTNMQFNNLCAGNYIITATDSLGQTATASAIITIPPVLELNGTRNGNVITYNATGGEGPYTYNPVDNLNGNTYTASNSNPVTALVTDNNGCTATHTF